MNNPFGEMREITKEEAKVKNDYLLSLCEPTGGNFNDVKYKLTPTQQQIFEKYFPCCIFSTKEEITMTDEQLRECIEKEYDNTMNQLCEAFTKGMENYNERIEV